MHDARSSARGCRIPSSRSRTNETSSRVVVPLIGEAHGDAIVLKGPQLLDQSVVELAVPLATEKRHDLLSADDELGPVAPATLHAVGDATRSGSRVFQPSSAARTFWVAVSSVNGGSGGRVSMLSAARSVSLAMRCPPRRRQRRRPARAPSAAVTYLIWMREERHWVSDLSQSTRR